MAKILKKTSFGLIRTNPRLTTNIKLVADTKDKIYLESIDADPLLSKSIYKGFEISNSGSYSFDVKRFFSQNGILLPNDIAYRVFEEDEGLEIKNRYKNQYDFTYGYGFYPKNSRIYDEEYSLFAPLWLEPDNIPERFVIFKMDGPVSVNPSDINYTGPLDDSPELEKLISDPEYFFDNYIKPSRIIQTFDLTEKSSLGKYIRNHVNSQNFPESSLFVSFEKGNQSFWNGISYKNGGFCSISNDIYRDYVLVDKTITESDDFITEGFRRNSVICANILNLEFLFDDEEQEKYSFSRYFGLYMSEVELGRFILDNNRLYEDKNSEITQYPKYEFNNLGSPTNYKESQIQNNDIGVKIYPKIKKLDGTPGIYSGRLLTQSELRNPRFGYVKDTIGNLYSISNNSWNTLTDSNYIRLKNKKVDLLNFSGFESPFNFVDGYSTNKFGRPGFSFKVIGIPTSGDELRIQYTDWNSPKDKLNVDNYTIIADTSLPDGKSNGLLFSVNGNLEEIAKSISDSINNIKYFLPESDDTIFNSIYKGNEVFIYSKTDSENWNKLKISFYSEALVFPFDLTSVEKDAEFKNLFYQKGPISNPLNLSPLSSGWYLLTSFNGGNQNPKSRAIINKEDLFDFKNEEDEIFVKTKLGYDVIKDYGLYFDEPVFNDSGQIIDFTNIDKYYVINLKNKNDEFEFGSSSKISLSKLKKNICGYLSIFPVKDFDFRYKSDEYNKSADSNPTKLWEWYKSQTVNGNNPVFNYSLLDNVSKGFINEMIGPTSSFILNGGFQTLNGYTDPIEDITDPIFNEYDRLKENYISELSLSSKVVPFINKWIYDNESTNVREIPYRLNSNAAFGFSNFSPSFENIQRSTKFFTHEWYYLQKYPPYMNFEEKVNSFSYFDEDLNNVNLPEFPDPDSITYQGINGIDLYLQDKALVENARMNLLNGSSSNPSLYSIQYDYFLNYFTRETVDGFPIKRDFRYSIFSNGDSIKPAETLFRGVKVQIKDRTEFSDINFNKETLKYINSKKYNDYKFSCVLTYGNSGSQITVIKNDKFKCVTLVIQSDINDDLTTYYGSNGSINRFIDRSHLYSISNILEVGFANFGSTQFLKPKNKKLSGIIYDWIDEGNRFKVFFKEDENGTIPQLFNEITINNNGTFNNVEVKLDTQTTSYLYTFKGITKVEGSIFYCSEITGLPQIQGSLTPQPNFANSLINVKNNIWGLVPSGIFMLPFKSNPTYINGGDGGYLTLIDELSFSSIANRINSGDPEIKYINVTPQGNFELNTFVLDLIKPDYPVTSTYLKREVIKKSSRDLQVNEAILGYEISALPRVIINNITRYRGSYNPKFRDIINFVDTNDLKLENLDFLNIQILTKIKNPYNIEQVYQDKNLGKILELYSNKVNVENPNIITTNSNFKDIYSVYPLIGEIAIDDDDFFIFKSNWDANYYKKYSKSKRFEYVIGTREPKEEKSFFGSKAISIPNEIRIEKFLGGLIEETVLIDQFSSIDNTSYNIIKKSKSTKDKTEIILDVFVSKALEDWLLNDGISKDFIKYINPEYSFGDYGLNDDIRLYIKENITQRYIVKEIIFWEKTYKFDKSRIIEDQIVTGFTDPEKISNGYSISKDFKTITNVNGGLDFSLIYTLPKDRKTSISISVVLEKK